jgi:hypothetical protein
MLAYPAQPGQQPVGWQAFLAVEWMAQQVYRKTSVR